MVFISPVFHFIRSPQHDRPDGDDSADGVPPASLAQSSSKTATDPPHTHDGMGEATLSSSSILPDHRAMLDTAFTKFRSTEAGIMEVFLGLAKGFEVSAF